MPLKYKNITISGGVASGKGTLANNLNTLLGPKGWHHFSGSQLAHQFAPDYYDVNLMDTKKAHHSAIAYDDATDRFIDGKMVEMLQDNDNLIVDAWIAGFNARDLPHTLRVLLTSSEPSVIIDRVANRDHSTIAEAKEHVRKRMEDNFTKWKRLYGDYDFFDPPFYHLVIDTYSSGPMETMGKVLDALGYR